MRRLEPLLFHRGRAVDRLELAGVDDPAAVLSESDGHFGLHQHDGEGKHVLARDPLGVHKLFFAIGDDGRVDSATFLVDLLRAGHPFAHVLSVPMGQLLKLDVPKGHYALERYRQLDYGDDDTPTTAPVLEAHARTIRSALERTFSMLKEKLAGRTVYVTLSGGLDSTTIAAMARKTFDDLHAVSFAIEGEDAGGPGTDLHFARRAAADLGIPLVEIVAAADEVAALVDDVLVYGQDFRDFNVHCALVNAAIGRALGVRHADDGSRPVVLTGDTMNELLADYTPVQLEGREYYGLPNLGPGRIRRFLVGGLDAGDREVGVFDHFGVDTVQPYALCAAEYAALPGSLVAEDGAKSRLVQAVMGTDVPPYIYDRPKVRAQVASQDKPSGTLALLVGRGIDQARLTERFAELMGVPADEVPRLIRAGFYRFSTIFPAYAC